MTEQELKTEARLIAIEYMIAHIYNMVCKSAGATEELISLAESDGLDLLALNTTLGVDPAMSDMISAEVLDAIAALLQQAREMRGSD